MVDESCIAELNVELVAYTPNPVEVVGRAAGICWDREEKEDYATFVRRIIKIGHESVIEHVSFTFRVEGISRALTHQWVRHRICSFSQRSQRFVKETDMSYIMPKLDYISDTEDAGLSFPITKRELARRVIDVAMNSAWDRYAKLLAIGVKGEDARFVLPNACETKMVWTANARELRHFFKLRLDKHAQWEIRDMAKLMFKRVMIVAAALFDDLSYLLEG